MKTLVSYKIPFSTKTIQGSCIWEADEYCEEDVVKHIAKVGGCSEHRVVITSITQIN